MFKRSHNCSSLLASHNSRKLSICSTFIQNYRSYIFLHDPQLHRHLSARRWQTHQCRACIPSHMGSETQDGTRLCKRVTAAVNRARRACAALEKDGFGPTSTRSLLFSLRLFSQSPPATPLRKLIVRLAGRTVDVSVENKMYSFKTLRQA